MKILYLCADPGIPIRGSKGASVHVRALTDAFAGLGHSVTVVSPRGGPSDGARLHARLIEAPAPDRSAGQGEQIAQAAAASVYETAYRLLREEPFDLIYERYSLWSEAGARVAPEFGLPYIVEVNAPLRREAARYRSLADPQGAARVEARVIGAASAMVAVSEPLRAYLLEQGAAPAKIHVIPNAVDDDLFHPAVDGNALRARLGLSDRLIVGFVGTTRPWHDLETWIAAMARLKASPIPYHLLLVGEISDSVHAAIAASGLKDRTTIVGTVPHDEIPRWLAAMDVAVSPHPALSDFYFSPLKIFEYLACGRPVVAADLPPISDLLEDGVNGLLYAPGDVADLASCIDTLARDPALRTRLGFQGARHVLLHHTWKQTAQAVLEVAAGLHAGGPLKAAATEAVLSAPIWDERIGIPLYRATRLDLASESLRGRLRDSDQRGALWLTGWEMLKYNPGRRCVIAYKTTPEDGATAGSMLIGKVFRDQRGAQYLEMQRALWEHGFGRDAADHITVAKPIAYIPEMNMFLQGRAPGLPLDHFIDQPGFAERAAAAAAVIGKLHDSRVRPQSTYSLDAELANLDGWCAGLCELRPDLSRTFRLQLERLHALAREVPAVHPVPIHRDFHYGQLLIADRMLTLIDLDLLALGDPVLDVANFAAHLQFLAIQFRQSPHDLDGAKEAFMRAYLRRRSLPAVAARFAFYEAATFFRLMFVSLSRPPLRPFFGALLQATHEKTLMMVETR